MAVFRLFLDVNDEDALFDAALEHAIHVDNCDREYALELLRDKHGDVNVSACLGMLLDPGSLPGCSIDFHEVDE